MSEEKELALPRYVLYDSKELQILCACEHGEPIIDYINALLRIKKESSIKSSILTKKDEIEKEMELLKRFTSQLRDTMAATKEAAALGIDISKITDGESNDGSV